MNICILRKYTTFKTAQREITGANSASFDVQNLIRIVKQCSIFGNYNACSIF